MIRFGAQPHPIIVGELFSQEPVQAMVEILATETVATARFADHFKAGGRSLQHRRIEVPPPRSYTATCSAGTEALLGVMRSGCHRLKDQFRVFEAGRSCGLDQGVAFLLTPPDRMGQAYDRRMLPGAGPDRVGGNFADDLSDSLRDAHPSVAEQHELLSQLDLRAPLEAPRRQRGGILGYVTQQQFARRLLQKHVRQHPREPAVDADQFGAHRDQSPPPSTTSRNPPPAPRMMSGARERAQPWAPSSGPAVTLRAPAGAVPSRRMLAVRQLSPVEHLIVTIDFV